VNESGEYLRAVEEEGIGPDHIRAELGEVLVGSAAGRDSDEELTLFRLARPRRRGPRGSRVPLPAGAQRRRRRGGSVLIPLEQIRGAQERLSGKVRPDAATAALPRTHQATIYLKAREPAANRLVQAARSAERDLTTPPRTSWRRGVVTRAPGTWAKASLGRRGARHSCHGRRARRRGRDEAGGDRATSRARGQCALRNAGGRRSKGNRAFSSPIRPFHLGLTTG